MALGLGGSYNAGNQSATNDPFYRYKQFQQQQDFDWTNTPVIGGPSGYLEQNPDATYNRWLTSMGVGQGDVSPYAEWLRRQFQETQLGFKTALAEDPTLTYQNYLQRLGANVNPVTGVTGLRSQWDRLSPQQRGLNVSRFAGPSRTISDI